MKHQNGDLSAVNLKPRKKKAAGGFLLKSWLVFDDGILISETIPLQKKLTRICHPRKIPLNNQPFKVWFSRSHVTCHSPFPTGPKVLVVHLSLQRWREFLIDIIIKQQLSTNAHIHHAFSIRRRARMGLLLNFCDIQKNTKKNCLK